MFTICLENIEEVNVILTALGKLPLEQSVRVWNRIKLSAEQQLKEQEQENAD